MGDVWADRLKALALVITACAACMAAYYGHQNNGLGTANAQKIEAVHEVQQVNAAKIDDTKKAAEDTKKAVLGMP